MCSFLSATSWTKIAKIAQLSPKFRPEATAHVFQKVCRTHSHVPRLTNSFPSMFPETKGNKNLGKEDDLLNPQHCLTYESWSMWEGKAHHTQVSLGLVRRGGRKRGVCGFIHCDDRNWKGTTSFLFWNSSVTHAWRSQSPDQGRV